MSVDAEYWTVSSSNWQKKQPPEVSYKKAVLRNFARIAGKHLCLSLFLRNLPASKPATLLERDSNTGDTVLDNLVINGNTSHLTEHSENHLVVFVVGNYVFLV